jgi:hypothetical protein
MVHAPMKTVTVRKTPRMSRNQRPIDADSDEADLATPPAPDADIQGRTGEGAHSAMQQLQEQERRRVDQVGK